MCEKPSCQQTERGNRHSGEAGISGTIRRLREHFGKSAWLFPLIGVLALIWFLVRVLPKPSRARYPCQRVAMPLGLGFLGWLAGLTFSALSFSRVKRFLHRGRFIAAAAAVVVGLGAAWFGLGTAIDLPAPLAGSPEAFTPREAANSPMGKGRGIHPGRVAWTHDPKAVSWDGKTGNWWDESNLDSERVHATLHDSLTRLTGENSPSAAWRALFTHFNKEHGRHEGGYVRGEKIAIKVNLNCSASYEWNQKLNNSPQMIHALLDDLVNVVGVRESHITVVDPSRYVGVPIWERCHSEFPNVHYVDCEGARGREKAQPDKQTTLHYADPEVPRNEDMHLPKCMVEADYLINLALLKGHTLAGVTLNAKNHFGSVWWKGSMKTHRNGWDPSNMHKYVTVHDAGNVEGREMGTYNSLVELMGHRDLDGKTMLFLIEGFYAAQHQGGKPLRWESAPFNGQWPASLFASQDGVAIESVAVDFCRTEPTMTRFVNGNVDNYLHEAAQAGDPPSGVTYDPEDDGTVLESLGVHEHWNNARDRQYSRNLGKEQGIELVTVRPEK